jgi:uncharacterized membrane protein
LSDSRLEVLIGRVMRAGILASSLFLASGLVVFLLQPGRGLALLTAGVLVLIATPVVRVAVSIVEYVAERDWLFASLTAVVLAELAASVVAALVFHRRL